MPVPIITDDNSILTKRQGAPWVRQFAATESPTSWTINVTPPGCDWESTTGTLTGPCTVPGEYNLMVYAINGVGTSQPLKVFLGVTASSATLLRSGPTFIVDVDTLTVKALGLGEGQYPYIKAGDKKLIFVQFMRGDKVLDIGTLSALTMFLKSAQNEIGNLAVSSEVVKVGVGEGTYYIIALDLTAQKIRTALSEYDSEDDYLYMPWYEFEVKEPNPDSGTIGDATLVWSTRSQQLILAMDLGSAA